MSEEYSTQIDDLPDDVSVLSYHEENKPRMPKKKKSNTDESLFMDSSVLFVIMMMVTNKNFVKWVSQYNNKGHIVLSLILSIVCVLCFVLYKIILIL